MEVEWIEDLVVLAQYRSFSRAAEVRNLTQSGFSRRIQALEQWVGADLVDRSSYPLSLTPAGQLFKEAAEDILRKLFDTRSIIRTDQRMQGPGIRIAAGHTLSVSFLPAWLNALSGQFGELRARVLPTNVHDSILMLVNGNCELMLAYHHPELSLHLDPTRYEHLTVGRDVFMPVRRPAKRAAAQARLPGTARQPVPLIGYTSTTYFGRCLALVLRRQGNAAVLQPYFESDMAEVLKKMALASDGIAWLPRSLIEEELASGALVPAGERRWMLDLELRLYRDRNHASTLLAQLWTCIAEGAAAG
ncbi:LysR substrate-binding domain-containing protein [Trinickia caryophylli]|uniref:Transcriptional regulator, LysR family n=1 Tax=Trinickia caryophylli TaxID=28094 RepID=A0A1X7FMG4_TRICW|nr:LysR substrate-binding domain-containing protein [Trinickia caryophylli]PMS13840.1 LysR family transcriptional regulator [Trinickia caryophylli]TRX14335.1 LysR family transcriptional regulator [Trinickia caryophylli]WQE14169.1 LysR substrate-binding domain-containing protein [Trinickia caryophylli]SMF55098.1 transcriptional regulator, LysR family [Trinickia caryophylli]GLU33331.1 LysR family transcriptional regulator [Trinickia caryophylli]